MSTHSSIQSSMVGAELLGSFFQISDVAYRKSAWGFRGLRMYVRSRYSGSFGVWFRASESGSAEVRVDGFKVAWLCFGLGCRISTDVAGLISCIPAVAYRISDSKVSKVFHSAM